MPSRRKYFRFWDVEDRPDDVTFDKYQKTYFHEKRFDVSGGRRPVESGIPGRELGLLASRPW